MLGVEGRRGRKGEGELGWEGQGLPGGKGSVRDRKGEESEEGEAMPE